MKRSLQDLAAAAGAVGGVDFCHKNEYSFFLM
jgi:hypothetical protein